MILLLKRINNGANIMLITTAAKITDFCSEEIILWLIASVNATNPNSPPWAKIIPVLKAVSKDSLLKILTTRIIIIVLVTINVPKMTNTCNQILGSTFKSKKDPTIMKNSPKSTSLNGLISSSIWWRNSVSPSIRPAKNAPNAIDNSK